MVAGPGSCHEIIMPNLMEKKLMRFQSQHVVYFLKIPRFLCPDIDGPLTCQSPFPSQFKSHVICKINMTSGFLNIRHVWFEFHNQTSSVGMLSRVTCTFNRFATFILSTIFDSSEDLRHATSALCRQKLVSQEVFGHHAEDQPWRSIRISSWNPMNYNQRVVIHTRLQNSWLKVPPLVVHKLANLSQGKFKSDFLS